jgi:hypothetical protein
VVRHSLSRRKPATTVRQSNDQARVCLAAPPPASATQLASSTRASRDGRPVKATRGHPPSKLIAQEAAVSVHVPVLTWADVQPAVSRGSLMLTQLGQGG